MQVIGVLPEDAPDPRLDPLRRVRGFMFPIMGLVPQRTIEDPGFVGFIEGGGLTAVSFTYVLWRNPGDRGDPVNLRELDDDERAAIDHVPPWPRPPWLIEYVETLRYPHLWEAVRTTWSPGVGERDALSQQLRDHTNHILMNQFRKELSLPPGPTLDGAWRVSSAALNPSATLEVDGQLVPAVEIDTDPFVYAIGAQIEPDVVTTVVIARDHLQYVDLALQTVTS